MIAGRPLRPKKPAGLEAASFPPDLPGGGESGAGGGRGAQGRATAAPRRARPQRARPLTRCAASALRPACREEAAVPQVSVRPAHAPQQPPAASLSEPPSCPPAVPAATGQLSRSRMRPPAVAARTVCGLGGWCVRRGPRGPQLPPRAARRKVRGSRDGSNPAPNEPSPGAAAALSRAFRTSQVPLRGSRRPPAARARRPTSAASQPARSARIYTHAAARLGDRRAVCPCSTAFCRYEYLQIQIY